MQLGQTQNDQAYYFYLNISGQIESGNIQEEALFVKYDFVFGEEDWIKEYGQVSGGSQIAIKSSAESILVWNFPFEIAFKSKSPSGWPQLTIQCIGPDAFGRDVVKSYGTIHVPIQPGRHVRYLRTFSIANPSWIQKMIGWLRGRRQEFIDAPKLLAGTEGREVARVQSGGAIKIVFDVSMRNMEKLGYYVSTPVFLEGKHVN